MSFSRLTFLVLCLVFAKSSGLSVLPENRHKGLKPFVLGQNDRRAFLLSGSNAERLGEMMTRKNFSFLMDLKQRPNTEGTLLAIYSRPDVRVIDIFVDGKQKEIKISFRVQTGALEVLRGEKDLTDGDWHKLIFEVQNDSMKLFVDCELVLGGNFPEIDFSEMRASYARPKIWVGQLDRHLSLFTGSLKEFSADGGSLSKKLCNNSATTRPTAVPDLLNADHAVSYLNHRVRYLENEFKRWREVVDRHDRQLQAVHLHQRGCKLEESNILLQDGEKWVNESSCTECQCHRGESHCKPKGCPKLACSHPVLKTEMDPCCPVCGKRCFYMGKYYQHGHTYWPKKCVRCSCHNGEMRCSYEGTECPPLNCPEHQQTTPGNQCCPVCADQDFCSSNPCHLNATCTNHAHGSNCECKDGFFGSGFQCYDIDECLWKLDLSEQLGGCGKGTRCINTPGSFRCECLPGYIKIGNSNSCIDVVLVR